ncbi:helix-turn-helix transcriptional regulator [Pedobacter sp. MR2016-19]|uniref:helix-turn-helix transcriptional regulator n=1 Tax=Pedobacter sp. MR2016-19 TaxID=2780089 RepID=UPI001876FB9C|nr:helix-turn-helix transcriptional regulator [Pedobacter sp. MR2016-19]MBE5318139.1 helix-turn-helix transcriptional regulator [Pedobacter sp. MR2016-19]
MKEGTLHIKHRFELTAEWQQEIVDGLGNKLIDDKYMIHDGRAATGFSLFLAVMPGLSVLLMDVVYHIDVAFTRMASREPLYLMYFDLNEGFSTRIVEGDRQKVRYSSDIGMGFIDSDTQSTLIPSPGERYYSLRIFASKQLINSIVGEVTLFFNTHVDSASRLILNELKDRPFNTPSYELLLKGVALRVLTNTLNRVRELETSDHKMSNTDVKGVMETVKYLTSDLLMDFPGLETLAEIAGMSISKYKIIFSKMMNNSPQRFFTKEKLSLANNLLQKGTFASIKDVALELGYGKPGHFAAVYKKNFGYLPSDVFVKKVSV